MLGTRRNIGFWKNCADKRCYICHKPWMSLTSMQLHHRTYKNLGKEKYEDLVPICSEHHDMITTAWNNKIFLGKTFGMSPI